MEMRFSPALDALDDALEAADNTLKLAMSIRDGYFSVRRDTEPDAAKYAEALELMLSYLLELRGKLRAGRDAVAQMRLEWARRHDAGGR